MPSVSQEALSEFLATAFPQARCQITAASKGSATVVQAIGQQDLRPGGTVSGPVMMGLADVALYVAVLATIGIVPMAVTTNLNINFLRKPSASASLIGECRLLKVGRTLAIGEVNIYSEGDPEPVAHAVGTYAIPPQKD